MTTDASKTTHRLLVRQLGRLGLSEDKPPATAEEWSLFLARVSASYTEADQDRYTVERSLEISSTEMQRLYQDLVRSSQTELAQERDKLQKSVATLHATLEASLDGVLVIDQHGRVVDFNQRFLDIWKLPEEQMEGARQQTLQRHTAAFMVDPDEFERGVSELYGNPTSSSYEELALRDGRILERFSAPVLLPAGSAFGRVWFFRDVTMRRRAEEEVRQVSRFLDSIVENIPDMVFVKDADTLHFVRLNRAGEELTGWNRDELLGKGDHDFFPPEAAAFFERTDREVLREGKLVDIAEEMLDTRHKGQRVLHTKKIPIRSEDGTPRYLLGISRDITDEKRAERELREAKEAAEKASHLMHAILDSMNEGVVAVDQAGRFTLFNQAAEVLLGGRATASARTDEEPGISIARALAGQSSSDVKVVVRHPDPDQPGGLHLSVSARPLEDSGRRRHGAVAVFRDMTRLIELDRFKEEMTSLLVHDLKNLIAVIRSSVDFALDCVENDPVTTEALVDAKDAGERGLRLLANLLDVTRLESSRLALAPMRIEVTSLFDSVAGHRTSQLRVRGVALETSTGSAMTVTADQDLVLRVIENTLDNAVRYTPRGGRITLSADAVADDRVQIRIGNSGPAIPAEYRESIFEKYGQAAPGGTMNLGLGLYFCRLAIAAHGGRIWVESTAELPTIFVIELAGTRVDAARRGDCDEDAGSSATLAS